MRRKLLCFSLEFLSIACATIFLFSGIHAFAEEDSRFNENSFGAATSIVNPVSNKTTTYSLLDDDDLYSFIIENNNWSEFVSFYNSKIYTPRETPVSVFYVIDDDISPTFKEKINNKFDSLYPNAERLYTATAKFNCHSFAWYSNEYSNLYWMNDPSAYYTDGSYTESTGKVGDIICYYNSKGENIHSGIVTEVLEGTANGVCENANLYIIESKWGAAGVYRHRGDECPYTNGDEESAVSIKFYARNYHNYEYKYYSKNGHKLTCTICGLTTGSIVSHVIFISTIVNNRYAPCIGCNAILDLNKDIAQTLPMSQMLFSANGSYIYPSGTIALVEEDIELYLNGLLKFYSLYEIPNIY